MAMLFIWDEFNDDHIGEHNIDRDEAQFVLEHARVPYPAAIGTEKFIVCGTTRDGVWIQVVFVYRELEDVDVSRLSLEERIMLSDDPEIVYVIHARPLTEREKRNLRRRRRHD